MIQLISIIALSLVTVISAMQDQEPLITDIGQYIRECQENKKLREAVPEGLDDDAWNKLTYWYIGQAATCCGDLYHLNKDGMWNKIRDGEYATLQEFEDSLSIDKFGDQHAKCSHNIDMHISRNSFPWHTYHYGTKTLMYLTHAKEEQYRRLGAVTRYKEGQPNISYFPMRLVFEYEGAACSHYDLPWVSSYDINSSNEDKVEGIACSPNGMYYAVCSEHSENNGLKIARWYDIKIIKRLSSTSYGDDVADVLTRGNDAKTKAFTHIAEEHFGTDQRSPFIEIQPIYFKNNHVNLRTITEDGQATKWVISPEWGLVGYPCNVDVVDRTLPLSLGALARFKILKKRVMVQEPELITSEKIRIIQQVLMDFLPELRQKILYNFCHVSPNLQEEIQFVYGKPEAVFSGQEKKIFSLLYSLKSFIDLYIGVGSGCDWDRWQEKKHDVVKQFDAESQYPHNELWEAARQGILWEERSYHNCWVNPSQLLFKYLFQQLVLPQFKVVKGPLLDGELIIDSEGKLSVNHLDGIRAFCGYLRDAYYKEYQAQKTDDAVWGTSAHAQQFIDDTSVKEVIFERDDAFKMVLNNGVVLPVEKRDLGPHGFKWEPKYRKFNTGAIMGCNSFWKSSYDSRTEEEIEAELNGR